MNSAAILYLLIVGVSTILAGIVQVKNGEQRSMREERELHQVVCACTLDYSPVCGLKNGVWKDYPNQCSADCSFVESSKPGFCNAPCVCTRHYRKVCARKTDGTLREFSNECMASCDGAVIVNYGSCQVRPDNSLPHHVKKSEAPDCFSSCPKIYAPVCGEWERTKGVYSSRCLAECLGATNIENGKCPPYVRPPASSNGGLNEGNDLIVTYSFTNIDSKDADDSNDADDSDLVAAQLPYFPNLFKRMFQR